MSILPVNAISYISDDTILVAQGSSLSVCQGVKISSKSVLSNGTIIHGIVHCGTMFLAFGQKEFQLVEISQFNIFTPLFDNPITLNDWIINCHFLAGCIYILTIHNDCVIFRISDGQILENICAPIRSIIYSADTFGHNFDTFVIAAGTVTNQIILWRPSKIDSKPDVLIGHKGVIFNVKFNDSGTKLVSVSDDRSVRVWNLENENGSVLIATLFGHLSRIWRAQFVPFTNDTKIISISEDTTLKLWCIEKCENIHTFVGHKGKSIWTMDISQNGRYVYTGGNDCSVRKWNLSPFLNPKHLEFVMKIPNEIPRIVLVLNSKNCLVLTKSGKLWQIGTKKMDLIYENILFASYSVMALNLGGVKVALGGIQGEIVVMNVSNWNVIHQSNILGAKILSLKWFCEYLIISCQNGEFIIANFACENVTFTHSFLLPHSNHRWLTTICIFKNFTFIVGDGKGSLHLFSNFRTKCPIHSLFKIHGPVGPVTSLQVKSDFIYSTGRDGKLKIIQIKNEKLVLKNSIQICRNVSWVERVYFDPFGPILAVLFHGNEFLLVNARDDTIIFSVPCGGGHRGWDINTFKEILKGKLYLSYIKYQEVISVTKEIEPIFNHELSTPFLGREGLCVAVLHTFDCDTILLAAGDETGNISTVKCSLKSGTQVLTTFQCHIGNINAMEVCQFENSELLLFTSGGRGLLKAWEVNKSCLLDPNCIFEFYFFVAEISAKPISKQKGKNLIGHSEIDDFRITTLTIWLRNEFQNCVLFCGCSDGLIRVYHFSRDTNFTLISTTKHSNRCLLSSCLLLKTFTPTLLTAATDGKIYFWNLTQLKLFLESKDCSNQSDLLVKMSVLDCHQSGINSISVLYDSVLNLATISSVGDDNKICVTYLYTHDTSGEIRRQINHSTAHNSSIMSVEIFEFQKNIFLISVSRDERLKLFLVTEMELELTLTRVLDVTNISGMRCLVNDKGVRVFVIGEGLQTFNFIL